MAADGPRVAVRVPAKVNLFLAVRGARPDGFHELVTVFQTISVYDELRVGLVGLPGRGHHPASRRRMRLELRAGEGREPSGQDMPVGEDNLALRAGQMLGEAAGVLERAGDSRRDAAGREPPRTVLDVTKAIPVAGGMAGGSADAAAALVGLNELWGCELPRERLRELAGQLGSDVPFLVVGGTALATGRGTAMAQVLCRGVFHWVVWTESEPLPTPEVYRAWDRHCRPSEVEPDAILQALRSEDAVALGAALHNDLEPAAFALRPGLAQRKQRLLDVGALGAVLSGSGPTMLALAADRAHAQSLVAALGDEMRAPIVARSPVGGPDVLRL